MERWRYCALSEFNSITLPPIIVCVGLNFLTELLPEDLPGDPDFFCLGSVWARGAGERSTITLLEEDSDSTEDDFSSTWDDFVSAEEDFVSAEEDFVAEEEQVDSEKEEYFTSKEE